MMSLHPTVIFFLVNSRSTHFWQKQVEPQPTFKTLLRWFSYKPNSLILLGLSLASNTTFHRDFLPHTLPTVDLLIQYATDVVFGNGECV